MKKVKMKVNGIHCNGCATKIKNGINAIDMESKTDVNIETGEVEITFDNNKSTISELKSKIVEVGFSVENVELE